MKLDQLANITSGFSPTEKMPVLFVGHGHPMNALFDNSFTQKLRSIGQGISKPKAILMISAHWETAGTFVSTNQWPETIYDFGNFDERLFDIEYKPEGHPEFANEVIDMVSSIEVNADPHMGLDHGAWTVLRHIFPEADVPVFQLSINYRKDPDFHYTLGRELAELRRKGVLIMGSGNIVHNLFHMSWSDIDAQPHQWNVDFDHLVKGHIDQRRFKELVNYQDLGSIARMSIPTNDHYLPMLYTLGLVESDDEIEHIYEGYQYAGISMRCFKVG